MTRYLPIFILISLSPQILAQSSVRKAFNFLQTPNNARLSAIGGVNVSLADRDINLLYDNPALSGDSLAGVAAASYQFYVADIGQASFTYAHKFSGIGTVAFGIQHMNYGSIKGYDATGAETTDFKSGETALVISKGHQQANFRMGVSMKFAFSNIGGYRGNALMLDLGGLFVHPREDFTIGLSIRNLGFVLSDYSMSGKAKLPFEVQAGTTFKPEHMPIRFSLTAFGIGGSGTYYDRQAGDPSPGILDKLLRYLNLAAEVLVHRNLDLMIGYNYRIHQELKLQDAGGSSGVSFGFALRVKSFEFVFSRSTYVVGNAGYSFTLSKNIDKMIRRR
ncbi:MAG: type IX secretion system protein PorQ [Chryseolinea sp.]